MPDDAGANNAETITDQALFDPLLRLHTTCIDESACQQGPHLLRTQRMALQLKLDRVSPHGAVVLNAPVHDPSNDK